MVRSVLARLDDMLHAIELAERIVDRIATSGHIDDIERLALERAFEILSEASRHIPKETKADHLQTEWRLITGLGNILRHDYEKVEIAILIGVTNDELPALRAVLSAIRVSVEP